MSERVAEGEWPFIGPLTRGQAVTVFGAPVREELTRFVPDKCRHCFWNLETTVINRLTVQVVMGEIAITDATLSVNEYTKYCSGSKPNQGWADAPEICPKEEEEKRRGTTICW